MPICQQNFHVRTVQNLGVEGLYLDNILVEAIPAHNCLALPGTGTVVAEVVGHPDPVGSPKTTAAQQSRKMSGRVFLELGFGGEYGFTHAAALVGTIALCLGYGSGRGTAMHHRDVIWELGGGRECEVKERGDFGRSRAGCNG